jgi:hypothetical protein
MFPNAKPTERMALLATLDPVSQAAATVTTGWVDLGKFHSIMALLQTGVMGASATIDAKLQQATSSGGAGAKDVTGKSITQLVKASNDNNQVAINCRGQELDVANGFEYVRLSVTVGTAACLIAAQVWGVDARLGPTSAVNQAGLVQTV